MLINAEGCRAMAAQQRYSVNHIANNNNDAKL